uniref:Uncharacterized protein n=1 Tax=Schizaphis graminum TaxID=13262 RepID=A0A2S2NEL5_SCHGA
MGQNNDCYAVEKNCNRHVPAGIASSSDVSVWVDTVQSATSMFHQRWRTIAYDGRVPNKRAITDQKIKGFGVCEPITFQNSNGRERSDDLRNRRVRRSSRQNRV